MTGRNLAMKGAKMCEHCQSKAAAEKTVEFFFIQVSASTVLLCIIPLALFLKKKERRETLQELFLLFVLLESIFVLENAKREQ